MIEHFPFDDITITTTDNRREGAPVVLLVHGFPLDHSMWDAQATALDATCRVIAPDLRGYGRTTLGLVGDPPMVSMERYADDLAGLLDVQGIDQPVVFVGFSMGGYIAWQFLRKHPNKLRALVLCDTRAGADTDEARAMRHKMADHVQEWGAERVAEAMLPKLFAASSIESMHPMVKVTADVISSTDPQAIAAAQRGMAARPDMTSMLASIKTPTLGIVGAEDQLSTPDEMRGMLDHVPGGKLVVIPDAGHMSPVESPEEVSAALLEFVEGL